MPWSTSAGRTSTPEWRTLRRAVLTRDPVCIRCQRAPSRDVHHTTPHSRGGQDTLENCVGLCRDCHKKITAIEAAKARWPDTRRRPEEKHPGRKP